MWRRTFASRTRSGSIRPFVLQTPKLDRERGLTPARLIARHPGRPEFPGFFVDGFAHIVVPVRIDNVHAAAQTVACDVQEGAAESGGQRAPAVYLWRGVVHDGASFFRYGAYDGMYSACNGCSSYGVRRQRD